MKDRNVFNLIITILLTTVCLQAQNNYPKADNDAAGYGQVYQKAGLAPATINMQQNTQNQLQKLLVQQAIEKKLGKPAAQKVQTGSNSKPAPKSVAFFTPVSTADNFKIIADAVGQDDDQKALFTQLFAETKKGFDIEMTPQGRKNNLAAAMTFFIATTVTVYNDDPEPSEEATENLFQALTAMYDETPGMANVPNKDKQFLHDTFVSFSAMPLTFYSNAKETNDAEMMKLAKVVAGSLLLDILKINPNQIRFQGNFLKIENGQSDVPEDSKIGNPAISQNFAESEHKITKYTTNFDDGWVGTPKSDYVQLQRNGMEVRLFYVNKDWDTYPNTVDHAEHYWSKTVTPYFNVGNVQKWSGVEYPVIYFMQAEAVDKQTGMRVFVAMKAVFDGGGKIIVAISPDQGTYQQQFPHPNDLNKMLAYNKFGVTAQDIAGTWTGGGGGGVEYYNAYGYQGMSAISTSDKFVFNSNGSYQSTHDSANMNGGGTRFAKLQYQGNVSVSDWELTATNRVGGKSKKFLCQFVAVRGGFLLILTDSDYEPLKYTLVKKR